MVSREERLIHGFITGTGGPQELFDSCIEVALLHKYETEGKLIGPINNKDITNAIFDLNDKDKVVLYNNEINGQKLKEIFVVSIYLKYLDEVNPDKSIAITLPVKETSYDVALFITEKDAYTTFDFKKLILKPGRKGKALLIQVKEEYDFKEPIEKPKKFKALDLESLKEKVSRYDELVLAFNRRYGSFSTDDFNETFKDNKKVALILSPSGASMNYTDKQGKKTVISFEDEKYHFLLVSVGESCHIRFDVPSSLIKLPHLGG